MTRWRLFRSLRVALTVCVVCLALVGCSKSNADDGSGAESNIIVGFSQIGAESAWRTCHTQSMIQAAENAGIQLIYENAEQKQENQIKAIRSFIVYQVDVIVFVPIVQDGWDNVLREAKEAGIPVIVVDRRIRTTDESLYAGFIGCDGYTEGCNAAQFLLEKYADDIAANPTRVFNILELRGTDGSSMSDDRYQGFRDVIGTVPNFSIIYSESGDFLRSRGREIAMRLLTECGAKSIVDDATDSDDTPTPTPPQNTLFIDGESVDIIYSHNDPMTLGVLDVLPRYGINPGEDITIVTIDAEQEAIDALKSRKINCVVECNPKFGPQVMELVQTLLSGGEIPRITHINETVFPESGNFSTIVPRGY